MADYLVDFYVVNPEDDQPDWHICTAHVIAWDNPGALKQAEHMLPLVYAKRRELCGLDDLEFELDDLQCLVTRYDPQARLKAARAITEEIMK